MNREEMEKLAREDIEGLAGKLRNELALAAYIGVEMINQNKKDLIDKINDQASQKANKLLKVVEEAKNMPAIKVVKKYWGGVNRDYFFGDQTKIGE